ncbi:hypothetical protein [Geomobilimonas luticola]|uniref:Uncharacterized protein n=1 Tax=Geomobilimonas luticola TaxID=1114878 RepID=A0ABS5SHF2_9BACT|nr:hypothetical protein [Geomobilimonas luticola]MBT0654092.1 hypothetical protein [Geomobilimonas luticola]
MKTRLCLKPGQRGTKRLTDKYGDALVCVRFRYDAATRQRLKTVELIVERTEWQPPPQKFTADSLVAVKIEGYETDLRKQVKEAGGKWKPDQKLWYVRYGNITGTALEKHIHIDAMDK